MSEWMNTFVLVRFKTVVVIVIFLYLLVSLEWPLQTISLNENLDTVYFLIDRVLETLSHTDSRSFVFVEQLLM